MFICCPFHPCLPFFELLHFPKMCNKTSRRRWRRFLQCLENFSSPADLCFLLRTVLFGTLILRSFQHNALIFKSLSFLDFSILSHNCVVTYIDNILKRLCEHLVKSCSIGGCFVFLWNCIVLVRSLYEGV